MERSRLEPLGVPEAEYASDQAASRHGPLFSTAGC